MGSWSVYCGLSNISITVGQKCLLLPLRKNDSGRIYHNYMPLTLPIYGEYNDYGDIENIIENENTAHIEKYFGVNIQEFCNLITDGRRNVDDKYSNWYQKSEVVDMIKDIEYMWINHDVWQFMSTYLGDEYGGNENYDLGDDFILKKLGFEFVKKDADKGRYCLEYKHPNGSILYTDKTWIEGYISNLDNFEKKYNVDVSILRNRCHWDFYVEYQDLLYVYDKLSYILDCQDIYEVRMQHIFKETGIEKEKHSLNSRNFIYTFDDFKNSWLIEQLVCLKKCIHNMYSYSGTFEPMKRYLTPQCGEHNHHQVILEKFCEINKSLCYNEDEEE